ncbi:MAG: hypothetical protein M3328_03970 [Chloroflexota bacterium]|nr:hypothetical protein [Chloroflexota bacterium]
MAEAPLVIEPLTDRMIAAGEELVERARVDGVDVVAAFWLFTLETSQWRLTLATPLVDTEGQRAVYEQVWTLVFRSKSDKPLGLEFQRITVVSPNNSLVRALANASKLMDLANRLMFNTRLGGEFFDGVYIYFIAKSVRPSPGQHRMSH